MGRRAAASPETSRKSKGDTFVAKEIVADPSLTTKSDKVLIAQIQDAHAELARRGVKDRFVSASSAIAWVGLIFQELKRTTNTSYWLSSLPKTHLSAIKVACVEADAFLRSLGSWTVDEFIQLQRVSIRAVMIHLQNNFETCDVEMIAVSLRRVSVAFSVQFPGYIENGWVSFLLNQEDE